MDSVSNIIIYFIAIFFSLFITTFITSSFGFVDSYKKLLFEPKSIKNLTISSIIILTLGLFASYLSTIEQVKINQTFDGIWRQSDEWMSIKIEIKGNNYIFTESMGGNVDNKSGSLKIFKVESKNTFGEDITLDAIQLLDMPHKPILWLDSETNELQTPWTWFGKTKIYTDGGYLEGLIFKKD